MKRYFAYGSNMDVEQMLERCPDAKEWPVVELSDYEFFIDARGVASIREKEGKTVWGVVYEISQADEQKLDQREGVPTRYTKVLLPEIECFAYTSTSPQGDKPRDGYLEKIIRAAEAHHFPEAYINELKSWAKNNG